MSGFPLIVDLDDAVPVYAQIERQVRALVRTRRWTAGERIPSVRETAARLRVNPLTVMKAYRNLQDEGWLESRPGDGVFVAKGTARGGSHRDAVRAKLEAIVASSGLPPSELREILEEALQCSRSRRDGS
jgi:DNA-binding transcriptional regulator YhcF (GntR family)